MNWLHKQKWWRDLLFALLMFQYRRKGLFMFPGLCYFTPKQRNDFMERTNTSMRNHFNKIKDGQ